MVNLKRRWRIGPVFVAALMGFAALTSASGAAARIGRAQSEPSGVLEPTGARMTPEPGAFMTTGAADDSAKDDAAGGEDIDGVAAPQQVALRVNPGGLRVSNPTITVVLMPGTRPGVFRGSVTGISVIDARGSLVGWTIEARVLDDGADGLAARIESDRPHVIAGDALDAVAAGPASTIDAINWTPIGRATPGGGGGTYAVTAELTVRVPNGATAPRSVLLELHAR